MSQDWCLVMSLGWNDDVRTTEAYEAAQTHCYNPVAPAYSVWAYYVHGRQRRCQEDPVSLPSGRLKKTTRSSPHHVAQHRLTGSETPPPYAPRSSRFGSEPPSVEEDVDVWRYAIVSCMRIIWPNRVSRRNWIIAVSLGCFVSLRTSSFRTNWYHLMPSSIRRHHWSSALILRASGWWVDKRAKVDKLLDNCDVLALNLNG